MDEIRAAIDSIQKKKAELRAEIKRLEVAEEALLPLLLPVGLQEKSSRKKRPYVKRQSPKGTGKLAAFHRIIKQIMIAQSQKWFSAGELRQKALEIDRNLEINDVSAYLAPANTVNLNWLRRTKNGTLNYFSLAPEHGGTASEEFLLKDGEPAQRESSEVK